MNRDPLVLVVALAGALVFTSAYAQAPDSVKTRIGTLTFEQGFPTEETAQSYDEMDYSAPFRPSCGLFRPFRSNPSGWGQAGRGRRLQRSGHRRQFLDAKGVWLTANDTTIYGMVNVDLSQGPVVIEVPAGPGVGLIDDFWQRAITDFGLPGPERAKAANIFSCRPVTPAGAQGGLCPEGHDEQLQRHGSRPRGEQRYRGRSEPHKEVAGVSVEPARQPAKGNKVVSMSAKTMGTIPPDGIEYWARLSAFINNNPVHERDRFFMAMLRPLGIEKGKEFKPDARQRAILEDAAKTGS